MLYVMLSLSKSQIRNTTIYRYAQIYYSEIAQT